MISNCELYERHTLKKGTGYSERKKRVERAKEGGSGGFFGKRRSEKKRNFLAETKKKDIKTKKERKKKVQQGRNCTHATPAKNKKFMIVGQPDRVIEKKEKRTKNTERKKRKG